MTMKISEDIMIEESSDVDNNNCSNSRIKRNHKRHYYHFNYHSISHRIQLINNALGPSLFILLVLCSLSNLCKGDVEPKPHYDDATTFLTKLDPAAGPPGGISNDLNSNNVNSISSIHGVGGDTNNNNNGHFNNESTKSSSTIGDLGFIHAFIASISVILVSELGDKTFFIAAIMAMRHPRLTVFIGAISALALMTILSAVFGMAATIIPRVYTYYISTALFAIFGLKMLKEGYYMSPTNAQEELEEVQSDLRKREDELMKKSIKNNESIRERNSINNNDNDDTSSSSSKRRTCRRYDGSDSEDDILDIDHNNDGVIVMENRNNDDHIVDDHDNDINSDDNHLYDDDNHNITRSGIKSLFKTSSISSSSHNSDEGTSSCATTNIDHHGTIVIHNKNTTKSKLMRIIRKKSNYKTKSNGIELAQLSKGGCKNRLEKEVSATLVQDPESGVIRKTNKRSAAYLASRIFMQAFTMTFLAEWGDRSQLTTIILSAREDVYGVIVGGVLGHSMCTGLAVIGGRMIAQKISVRTVTLVGGVVFLLFAISALFFNPNEEP